MKKIFTVLLMAVLGLSAHAQGMTLQSQEEEDSTIAVIGYFCKNDTMKYLRTQGKMKIVDNDTTVMNQITEEFMVVVTDSTANGYKMELIPLSCEVEDSTENYETRLAALLWKNMKDLRCRFTTNELGAVEHIENWREIRDALKKCYVAAFDELYTSIPDLDTYMPRKQLESILLLGCSTEDGIKEQYDELDLLFGLHGLEYNIDPVEKDNVSEQGYPTHTTAESFFSTKEDEYDVDGDYVIRVKTDTKMSADDMNDLLGSTMDVLFSKELKDSVSKYALDYLKENEDGLKISNTNQFCYFFNGWPKLIQTVAEINIGNLVKRIEYDTIEWTSRRWGVFTFPEEEEKTGKDI